MSTTTPTPAEVEAVLSDVKRLSRSVFTLARERGARAVCAQLQDAAGSFTRSTRIAVVGERSRGKSSLINALLGTPLLPVDVDVTTNVYVEVAAPDAGAPTGASVHGMDGSVTDIGLDELERYATESGNPGNEKEVAHVDVRLAAPVLMAGMVFLDTPGVGGLTGAHGAAAQNAVAAADALLMVVDARAPMTADELAFLADAHARVGRVVVAATFADKARDVTAIVAEDRAAIARAVSALGDVPIVPVSSAMALAGLADDDPDLVEESDIALLATTLHRHAVSPVLATRTQAMAAQALLALQELDRPDQKLLDVIGNTQSREAAIAEVRPEYERLRSNPVPRDIERRTAGIPREIDARMRTSLGDLRDELHDEIEAGTLTGQDELEERWAGTVEAMWNDACDQMDEQLLSRVEDACATSGLTLESFELSDHNEVSVSAEQLKAERGGSGQLHDRWLNRVLRGGTPLLMGIVTMYPPLIVVGAGAALGHETLQARANSRRQLAQFVDRSLRRATTQLAALAGERFGARQRAAVARVDAVYRARLEGLAATIKLLSAHDADPAATRARTEAAAAIGRELRTAEERALQVLGG